MPRLLLEGKSITELLERVRLEHGDDVTIVAADKVRTGGIGGFFARESYALTVEVGEDSAPAVEPDRAAAKAAQAPGSLLDLAAAIDAAEAAEHGVVLATAPMHRTMPEPVLSTASPEFHSILERLTALDTAQPVTEPLTEPAAAPAAAPAPAYERLREALAELAPEVNLDTGAPIVLVIAPPPAAIPAAPPAATAAAIPAATAAATPVPATAPVPTAEPASIPQQGRHRRAALSG